MAVLGKQAPLQAYPAAAHSGRPFRPEWEAELLDLARVEAYLAEGEWFRHTNCHGEFWLGQQRYNVGKRWGKHEVAIRFDPATRALVVQPAGSAAVLRLPIKGLSVADLMGDAGALAGLPPYQLALPFPRAAWEERQLAAA